MSQLSVDLHIGELFGNLSGGLSKLSYGLLENVGVAVLGLGISRLELFDGGVVDLSLLGLGLSSWEEDELALVALKSLLVLLKSFFGSVLSSMINSDTD